MGPKSSLTAAVLCLWAATAGADIYSVQGEDGVVSFTDTPVTPDYRVVIRDEVPVEVKPSHPWTEVVKTEAVRKRVDPLLVKAIIHVESGQNPGAVSPKGAMGLMQLMPGTARAMGVQDPFHPKDNIQGGVKYLSDMLDRFGGRLDMALAAYNAGPSAVERYRGIPPFTETRNYVNRVLDAYRRLSAGMSLDRPGGPMDNPVSVARRE